MEFKVVVCISWNEISFPKITMTWEPPHFRTLGLAFNFDWSRSLFLSTYRTCLKLKRSSHSALSLCEICIASRKQSFRGFRVTKSRRERKEDHVAVRLRHAVSPFETSSIISISWLGHVAKILTRNSRWPIWGPLGRKL